MTTTEKENMLINKPLHVVLQKAAERRKALELPDPKEDPPQAIEQFRRCYAFLRQLEREGKL
jgi:hypothetical protein